MTLKKSTIKNILTEALNDMATDKSRWELVKFAAKEVEELGEVLIYLNTTVDYFQRVGGPKSKHEGHIRESLTFIYSVNTHELMDKNYKTIWC